MTKYYFVHILSLFMLNINKINNKNIYLNTKNSNTTIYFYFRNLKNIAKYITKYFFKHISSLLILNKHLLRKKLSEVLVKTVVTKYIYKRKFLIKYQTILQLFNH